ncbi:MAG: UDP-N-acetylglucosamine 2-epimerase, partial [Planctomycetota bacterium]|nr:UDP-N-acetylglucosamine 2-epimerase [Planctomycetota bacterium]
GLWGVGGAAGCGAGPPARGGGVRGRGAPHVHGGDIASGICDEGIRHAVTKLAHLHFPATTSSASRIESMGEPSDVIHMVGSPAVDDLSTFPVLDEVRWRELGAPRFLVLHHPVGDPDHVEQRRMELIVKTVAARGPSLVMAPNHDPGCTGIRIALDSAPLPVLEHLPRAEFIGLLRRIEVLVGNSSAGLIECAAVGRPAVDIGTRQSGRERPRTVVHVDPLTGPALDAALIEAESLRSVGPDDRFGSGDAGARIARILADVPLEVVPLRKRWADPAPNPEDIHRD